MAPKKPTTKAAPKKITPPPLPEAPAKGVCGVDGYCCQGKSPEDCCGGTCGGSCKTGSSCTVCGCHVAGLLFKPSTWVMAVAAALTFWAFDMLWHGQFLATRYAETMAFWRPEADMKALWAYCLAYHGLLGLVFTLVFVQMGNKTILHSIKNGALITAPLAVATLGVFVTQTIPVDILQMWAVGHLIAGALGGLVLCIIGHIKAKSGCCGSGGCCN